MERRFRVHGAPRPPYICGVPRTGATIFTVGYEGRQLGDFVELLVREKIDRVLDIRALPLSRRKGFSKTPLGAALRCVGVEYVHVRAAGNPFRDQKQDVERCLRMYGRHLDAHPDVIDEVVAAARGHRAALLCVESDPRCCHRSIVADRLKARAPSWSVRDL